MGRRKRRGRRERERRYIGINTKGGHCGYHLPNKNLFSWLMSTAGVSKCCMHPVCQGHEHMHMHTHARTHTERSLFPMDFVSGNSTREVLPPERTLREPHLPLYCPFLPHCCPEVTLKGLLASPPQPLFSISLQETSGDMETFHSILRLPSHPQ